MVGPRGLADAGSFFTFSIIFATSFRTSILVDFGGILGLNMVPTWEHFGLPKRIKSELEIVVDSDAVLNTSWTRFWEDFGMENEGFWDVF